MGKLLEQRNRALDDINAGRTVKKIRDLESRVRELEEENARLKAECDDIKQVQFPRKLEAVAVGWKKQLAASQLREIQLREALEVVSIAPLVNDNSLPKYGVSVSEMKLVQKALAQPSDTSALDSFVAEKVKEYQERLADALAVLGADSQIEAEAVMLNYKKQVSTLTRQRDLAVAALEAIAGRRIFIDNLASNVDIAVMTLDAIKESEEN